MILTYVHNIVQRLTSANSEDSIVYYHTLWQFLCYLGLPATHRSFESIEDVEQCVINTVTQEHIDGFIYHLSNTRHRKIQLVALNRYINLLNLPCEIPCVKRRQNITNCTSNSMLQYDNKYLRNKLICVFFKDMQMSRLQIQRLSVFDVANYVDSYWSPKSSLPEPIQDVVELYLNQRSGQVHLDYRESDSNVLFISSHSGKKMKLNSISKIIRDSLLYRHE